VAYSVIAACPTGVLRAVIHGEKVVVRAKVHTLNGFSGHAGQSDLLKWLGAVAPSKPRVILTHGENDSRKSLLGHIQERFHLKAHLPVEL